MVREVEADGWMDKKKKTTTIIFIIIIQSSCESNEKCVRVCVCLAYSNVENDCPRFFVVVRTAE